MLCLLVPGVVHDELKMIKTIWAPLNGSELADEMHRRMSNEQRIMMRDRELDGGRVSKWQGWIRLNVVAGEHKYAGVICLEWRRRINGYGYIHRDYVPSDLATFSATGAHRVIWSVINQLPIYPGMVIRHLCNNRSCVQPVHLCVGSSYEKYRDFVLQKNGSL